MIYMKIVKSIHVKVSYWNKVHLCYFYCHQDQAVALLYMYVKYYVLLSNDASKDQVQLLTTVNIKICLCIRDNTCGGNRVWCIQNCFLIFTCYYSIIYIDIVWYCSWRNYNIVYSNFVASVDVAIVCNSVVYMFVFIFIWAKKEKYR